MNKLVALLRVKDGILFVNEWLSVMSELVDEIVVVDNGSTDGTVEILRAHPKVADLQVTHGFDEGRDKILAYNMARARKPDWCIWLDIDEIIEKRVNRQMLEQMMRSKKYTRYLFRRYDMINDYNHFFLYLTEIQHTFDYSRSMWREQESAYFRNVLIHNGDIQGVKGRKKLTHFRIKHLGYVNRNYVIRKTENYIKVDPGKTDLYMEHYKKKPGFVLKWREYHESPLIVSTQQRLYDFVFLVHAAGKKLKKIFRPGK